MKEAIYSIALTRIPKIGAIRAKRLLDVAGSATFLFENVELLVEQDEFPLALVPELQNKSLIEGAESMVTRMLDLGVEMIPYSSSKYPSRLKECVDAPIILFYKGIVPLNRPHIISIVGTRHITEYGRRMCNQIVQDLKSFDPTILIVSGLAYGVDVQSHRAALSEWLDTVGILAHGLDKIYPAANRRTAEEMMLKGGVLTEYLLDTEPDRFNFVSRNRIIAGMSDATIIVESACKGGSLITADLANSYDRDCFAVPGRVGEEYSVGCNDLIKNNKAAMIESGFDVVNMLQWTNSPRKNTSKISSSPLAKYSSLSGVELDIVHLLITKNNQQVDDLLQSLDIPINQLHAILFQLEMQGILEAKAGGMYSLV